MGLPSFVSKWLAAKFRNDPRFPGLFLRRVPRNTDCLAVDCNGLIHAGIAISWGLDRNNPNPKQTQKMMKFSALRRLDVMLKAILLLLERTVEAVTPRRALLIYVDGPTPEAKIYQQRERRFKNIVTSDGTRPDTSYVTVGTEFMEAFDVAIRAWFEDKRKILPPKIVYSNHLVPGEGEHKIMSYIRTEKFKNGMVLYGLDADLVMLSLISGQRNIFLMREDARNVIDIEKLKDALITTTPENLRGTALIDFVALIFNIGNDFLPHGPLHNSMFDLVEGLLKAYHDVGEPLTVTVDGEPSQIDFVVAGKILDAFGTKEAELCAREASVLDPDSFPNRFVEAGIQHRETVEVGKATRYFDYNRFRSVWYNNEFLPSGQDTEWGTLPLPTADDIEEMCERYCEGMAWSFRYYQTKKIDPGWYFPYHHAPLKMDLAAYLRGIDDQKRQSLMRVGEGTGELPYGPLEQLLSVIHPESVAMAIPEVVASLAYSQHSPLADMFPIGMIVEKDGVSFEMSYVFLGINTPLDLQRVSDAVVAHGVGLNPERWQKKNVLVYKPTQEYIQSWDARRRALGGSFKKKLQAKHQREKEAPSTGKEPSLKASKNDEEPSQGGESSERQQQPPETKKINYPVITGRGVQQKDIRGVVSRAAEAGFARKTMTTQYESNIGGQKRIEVVKPQGDEEGEKTERTERTERSEDGSRGRGRGGYRGGRGSRGRGEYRGRDRGGYRGNRGRGRREEE